MNNTPVEITVIMDRSGSMSLIRDDAIGGFNAFLEGQQSEAGEANLSLILFDHEYQVERERVPVREVAPLDGVTYVPRGTTALLDAIGRGLSDLLALDPERAVVCIITDGNENASREFTREQVRTMTNQCEAKGWKIIYLGANQDAFSEAGKLGIADGVTFQATGVGVRSAYNAASASTSTYRGQS